MEEKIRAIQVRMFQSDEDIEKIRELKDQIKELQRGTQQANVSLMYFQLNYFAIA